MPETNKFYADFMRLSSNLSSGLKKDIGNNGGFGTILAGPASTSTGTFQKAIFLTSGTLTSIVATGITGSTIISSGTTFPAGAIFAGALQSIKVKTGYMLIYRGYTS